MKKQLLVLVAVLSLLASSCKVAGTLYPLSQEENDFIFKKELIGKWEDPKDRSGYYRVDTLKGKRGRHYQVETVFGNKETGSMDTSRFNATLVSISGWYYLDCWVDMENQFSATDKSYEDWLIARHFIFRLSFPGANSIELSTPDPEELVKLIDQKKILLHYAKLKKDDYLILDKPAVLQKGFTESKKYPLLYKDKYILHRSS
ncbi:MAG: hypothetical protein ABIT05_03355 [Chitinophagaceae bacterium]